MKKYTINGNWILYGSRQVYAVGRYQDAQTIRECAENVHRFLLENTDISMLRDDYSVFDLHIFSCAPDDLPYIMDALNELNHDLQEEPDEEPYFLIDDNVKVSDFFGNVLVKQDYRSHYYKCYDMGVMDLRELHDLLTFS